MKFPGSTHPYIKVARQWKYLYRAVDRDGDTIDFLLRAKRDHAAARCFFEQAIGLHGVSERVTIDKSGANTAAIQSMQADSGAPIEMRQSKYLNNIVEQDHRVRQTYREADARRQVFPLRASADCRHRNEWNGRLPPWKRRKVRKFCRCRLWADPPDSRHLKNLG